MKFHINFLMKIAAGIWQAGTAAFVAPIPENCLTGKFAVGCQAWTFSRFAGMEAIDKTFETGVRS